MLSRIAEALFWIGRYVERAQAVARVLEVYVQLLVEDPTIDEEAACRSLLAAMGVQHDGPVDPDVVLQLLLWDSRATTSVAWAIESARESARRSREVVSTEVWEAVNTTYNRVSQDQLRRWRPADAFRMARERGTVIAGLTDSTLLHDTGWRFMVLGRSIEQVDMTARILLAHSWASEGADSGWTASLRSCGAHHAFTRTYRASESPRAAAEFLVLDRLFPRSVTFGLTQAATSLEALDPRQPRLGFGGEAARIIGQHRAALEIVTVTDLVGDLPTHMQQLQQVCADATEAVSRRYFEGAVAPQWLGGTP